MIDSDLSVIRTHAPEVAQVLDMQYLMRLDASADLRDFFVGMCDFVEELVADRVQAPPFDPIPGSFDPSTGVA